MKYTAKDIQERIAQRIPPGKVVTMHDERGHWYGVLLEGQDVDPLERYVHEKYVVLVDGQRYAKYPSVTGKLQILKDQSLINYKKNKIIQWVYANWKRLTDENVMELLAEADRVPEDVLADASDVGTQIHDCREEIFSEWIKTGKRPESFSAFISPAQGDIRLKSAIRALADFCNKKSYIPIATEMFVYSHRLAVAGTLDDIGILPTIVDEGDPECEHDMRLKLGKEVCWSCTRRVNSTFVLMDLKSSNQFKDHYFFQVAMYWEMLYRLIGIKPQDCFILKLSKEDGTFHIEDLKNPAKLATFAHAMLKTNDAVSYIKALRKDNQKNVAEKIEF